MLPSSPPRIGSPIDRETKFPPIELCGRNQENLITPLQLGGSRFRRKTVNLADISSSPAPIANYDINSNTPFDSQTSFSSALPLNSQPAILSRPRPESSNSSLPPVKLGHRTITACNSSGKQITFSKKAPWKKVLATQERIAASKAQKETYYGIDIHNLLNIIEHQSKPSTQTSYVP